MVISCNSEILRDNGSRKVIEYKINVRIDC